MKNERKLSQDLSKFTPEQLKKMTIDLETETRQIYDTAKQMKLKNSPQKKGPAPESTQPKFGKK